MSDDTKPATYEATDVAAWFLNQVDRESGDAITHLKLQKLVYYADAWALALEGRELVSEKFQAWAHGPVAYSLWDKLKSKSWDALDPDVVDSKAVFDESALSVLHQVQEAYGSMPAKSLEKMTHQEEPWLKARGNLAPEAYSNAHIDKQTTARFYHNLYNSANGEE